MPVRLSIDPFLKGPLSDRFGGSERDRQAALESFSADGDDADEDSGRRDKKHRELILHPAQPLFSYQQEIVDKLSKWASARSSSKAALVSLPTGGGKTRVGMWFFRIKANEGSFKSLLWVAPSSELVDQAVETLQALWLQFPGKDEINISVNHFPSAVTNSKKVCAFVTAQLAAKRTTEVKRFAADLLVFDEAHQSVARTFQDVIRAQLSCEHSRVLGLSATPGRTVDDEGDELQEIFAGNLVTSSELGRNPVTALRERGVLSRLEMQLIGLPRQWDQIRVRSLKGHSMSLDDLALHPARFWATVDTVTKLGGRSKTLVFAASLAHCFALNGALRARDIRAATVSHNTPAAKRSSILSQFSAGEIDVILNKTLLATGYDCPGISDVVLASPIRSPILWEQILGRASRGPAVGGTAVGRIWELDDHRKLHGKVLSYARFLGDLWS